MITVGSCENIVFRPRKSLNWAIPLGIVTKRVKLQNMLNSAIRIRGDLHV